MKRTILLWTALSMIFVASAQSGRTSVYDADGHLVKQTEPCNVTVQLAVEQLNFTPGVYARYAQKYLGTRASLAPRSEMHIIEASLSMQQPTVQNLAEPLVAEGVTLAPNRYDGRPLTLEEQAAATAELIFSLRKHRLDLVTGEAGENVFGAGLRAALDEIAALEKSYLEMFYGTTERTTERRAYVVTITAESKDYIVCRYREGEGLLPVENLAGEPVMLHIETSDVRPAWLVEPGPKDKVKADYLVLHDAECTLSCGTAVLARQMLALSPFALRVVALPLSKR